MKCPYKTGKAERSGTYFNPALGSTGKRIRLKASLGYIGLPGLHERLFQKNTGKKVWVWGKNGEREEKEQGSTMVTLPNTDFRTKSGVLSYQT